MANHKSALKRIRQNEKRRLRNRQITSRMKTAIKQYRQAAAAGGEPAALQEMLARVTRIIDKAATKGVLHRRNASRKISRLTRLAARQAGGGEENAA
ncbi:MAG: 30S ribosomal protein S20 [Deltaproteobacteria bacterium]|nr:30S ribosomal protein S20 [Deltaproteobacteria bacterium]